MKLSHLLLMLATACGSNKKETTPEPSVGYATYFDDVGGAGACGVPSLMLESQDFVALNVQDTPHDYDSMLTRPITDASKVGAYANGLNCGRWLKVEIGKECVGGVTDGTKNSPWCRGGVFQDGASTGAYLNMLVTDSCQDNNTFCRDSKYHLDLHTSSLGHFNKNGQNVNIYSLWNNPQITWSFIAAPNYQGDLHIALVAGAQKYWSAVVISNLPNGIHGVDALVSGEWVKASMQGDNGQVYLLPASAPPYKIRVWDAADQLVKGGKTYMFDFPVSCGLKCSEATAVEYTQQ